NAGSNPAISANNIFYLIENKEIFYFLSAKFLPTVLPCNIAWPKSTIKIPDHVTSLPAQYRHLSKKNLSSSNRTMHDMMRTAQ
ncbi:MAG TPA: hypothetical protein DCQ77_03645, partial [Betaproteobacteria bacterium]|nr:hypothetical protein [Betaproteobacteria bacterium]